MDSLSFPSPKIEKPETKPASVLVIGYGNSLRSDDGIGQMIAETVSGWPFSHVRAIAVHQLTPELVCELATAEIVIFVDASLERSQSQIQFEPIHYPESCSTLGHASSPPYLLALMESLYQSTPQAWSLTVPGVNFEVGDRLSSTAERNVDTALQQLNDFIQTISFKY